MNLTLSLGLMLAAGVLGNAIAGIVRLPKVTTYILLGLALGPSMLGWLPHEHLVELEPVLQLALGLVLFEMGTRFIIRDIRKIMRRVWTLSLGELTLTFFLVAVGLWALGETFEAAILLGALALATAPATTILVLREYDSEGPITHYTYLLVALNNLAAIILFEMLLVILALTGATGGAGSEMVMTAGTAPANPLFLLVELVESVGIGIVGGLAAALAAPRLSGKYRVLAAAALVTVVLGVCEVMQIPYLLAFLVMGVTMANASPLAAEVTRELERLALLLYVVFFIVAGAELSLVALWGAGLLGTAYIVLRSLGKYFGIHLVARWRDEPPRVARWLGCTLIAQAGAAIGLVLIAKRQDPVLGTHLQTIIVGTVVFFELAGPLLTKLAVVHGGEVPVAHVSGPRRPAWRTLIASLVQYLRQSFGYEPWHDEPTKGLTVGDLMRSHVPTLSPTDDFPSILRFIARSRNNNYPVVAEDGRLLGLIRYPSIRSAVFDPDLAGLVLAEDLYVPVMAVLFPSDPLDHALELFEAGHDDVIAVVASTDDPQLVGLVERRDVMRYMHRHHTENDQP